MTDFLFDRSSEAAGFGSVLDIFGLLSRYNDSASPKEADRRAFQADVEALKCDLDTAMESLLENVAN